MNTEDRQSKIIQNSLLKWISIFTKQQFSTFDQLLQGQFYIQYLSKVPHFKFIKPLKFDLYQNDQPSNYSLSLANKISNIKIIGESIVRYYQTCLMRDISQMKLNYVQLCMGNTSQNIKLFSFLIGIFATINDAMDSKQSDVYKLFLSSIQKLENEDQYIVKALLQNSKTIGQSISIKNDDSQKISNQKIIINQFEAYQEKIQILTIQIQTIKTQLQQQRLINQYNQGQIKQLKSQKTKLLQKCQILQVLNSRLQSQNSSFQLQNQNLVKKLQTQKRNYQLSIVKLNEKCSGIQKQLINLPFLKQKILDIQKINQQLKQQIQENNAYLTRQQTKFKLMKQNYSEIQQNYRKIQENFNKLENQYHDYKFQIQHQCSSEEKKHKIMKSSSQQDQYYLMMSNNSRLSSIKYRMKDRLQSALKGQLSEYQMINSNIIQIPIPINKKTQSQQNSQNHLQQYQGQNNRYGTLQGEFNNVNSQMYYYQNNLSNCVINQNVQDLNQNISQFLSSDEEKRNNKNIHDHEYKNQNLDQSLIIEQDQLALEQSIRQNKKSQKLNLQSLSQSKKTNQLINNQNQSIKNKQLLQQLVKYTNTQINLASLQQQDQQHHKAFLQKIKQNKTLFCYPQDHQQSQQQFALLITIISNLYDSNNLLKKQLKKYEQLKKDKSKRYQMFKDKLKNLRQFQSIQKINEQFLQMKQNISLNILSSSNNKNMMNKQKQIGHFPLSLNRNLINNTRYEKDIKSDCNIKQKQEKLIKNKTNQFQKNNIKSQKQQQYELSIKNRYKIRQQIEQQQQDENVIPYYQINMF